MIIRALKTEEYNEAIDLKVSCWTEELAGVAPNRMDKKEELDFVLEWINSAEKYDDIRLLYGAFEGDTFLGYAAASIAEVEDSENAIELNYLFVKEEFRGCGVSLKLMNKLFTEFAAKGFDKLVVYNHHYAPSNNYYRKLGGEVIRRDIQGSDKLEIDIFQFDLQGLNLKIEQMIEKKYNFLKE